VAATQTYLHVHLAFRETALAKMTPPNSKLARYRPADELLRPLNALQSNEDNAARTMREAG
jgi:hypothetical protein